MIHRAFDALDLIESLSVALILAGTSTIQFLLRINES